ncbi:MAG: hypothetical protein A2Y12_04530 [Planctomycetes bacterium GWF2_42_9]|nr:MAG: hypothetical protein A2Y12_04530 [Planctomycetes bacterium GWF2_42_9]HAL45213.1 hypothetical protein [Phycisphaerales bacterium]
MRLSGFISYILFAVFVFSFQADAITLNYVGGRVFITTDVAVGDDTIAANLIVDLGMPYPLILDSDFAKSLESKDNTTTVLLSKSSKLTNIKFQSTELRELREYTKKYATQLKEIPICGIIGLPAFENAAVLIDIQANKFEYGEAASGDDWYSINMVQTESGGYRVEVYPSQDYKLIAAITTGSYDTWIDASCAAIAGFPAADFEKYTLGAVNIAEYTAIRPLKSESPHPDALIGNSFWQNFQVIIDAAEKKIWLRPKGRKISDLKERDFFKAFIDEDIDAMEKYVDSNPSSRLIEEASEYLLQLKLADPTSTKEDIKPAVDRVVKSMPESYASEKLIAYADQLFGSQQYDNDIIPLLLEEAKTCAMKNSDATPFSYEAQGRLGRYMILKKDWPKARLHLLSALFGQPNNPLFNYWMGQYYEGTGQLTRAWSRYLKACIAENAPPESFTAIGQLNDNPVFRSQFSMQDAEEYLEDSIPSYNPAKIPDKFAKPQTTLIEAFTSVNGAPPAQLELALRAIADINEFTIIDYHIENDKQTGDPFETADSNTAAQRYKINKFPAIVVNGVSVDSNQLQSPEDPKYTLIAIAATEQPSITEFIPQVKKSDANNSTWTITIPSQSNGKFCEVYLVERKCMLPSSSLGMYHNVVRGCLYSQQSDSSDITFTTNLNKIQTDNAAYISVMETSRKIKFTTIPNYIDSNMCYIVAKIYDADGKLLAFGKKDLRQDSNNAEH